MKEFTFLNIAIFIVIWSISITLIEYQFSDFVGFIADIVGAALLMFLGAWSDDKNRMI